MNSDEKAQHYATRGSVFPLSNSVPYEVWGIEGKTAVHKVTYDKLKARYACTCKNIRLTQCSHIKAVLAIKG